MNICKQEMNLGWSESPGDVLEGQSVAEVFSPHSHFLDVIAGF